MMNLLSRLRRAENYETVVWRDSLSHPGVRFAIRRASLLQRIELTRRLKVLTHKEEFLRAGTTLEQTDAALADLLAKKLYLEWALADIKGLTMDGVTADVHLLIASGPEALCEEILVCIEESLTLSESERKNS